MSAIREGRICIKLTGRDAGQKVIITKIIDKNFVMIKSPIRKKERKCAIKHLEPTDVIIST
jgi:large subunit ribosomal protein L14e